MTKEELLSYLDNVIDEAAVSKGDFDMGKERRQVIVGWDNNGAPIYKNLRADSQDEMNMKVAQTLIECGRLDCILRKDENKPVQTVKDYSNEWLGRKRKLKPTTRKNYQKYLDEYIVPTLGNSEITDVKPRDVQSLLDKYKRLSYKTLKDMKSVLSQIMKYAISDGIIDKNPCDNIDIEIPSDKVTVRKALTIQNYKDILNNLSLLCRNDRLFVALCMYTGMRRGEILGLKKEDINISAKTIKICRNVVHVQENAPTVTTPKTKAGYRTIPIDENLLPLLEEIDHDGFVFGGEKPYTLSMFRQMWYRINQTIDMHNATPHSLRHSYLTYAVGLTTDYKTVQGLSGHADMNTLLNRYAHIQQDKVEELSHTMHSFLS